MRDVLHYAGLVLAAIGTGVGIVTANTDLAQAVAPGCAVAILAGAALCLVTHQPGVHGPRDGW